MVNTRMMYVRPGNLFKEFIIESNKQVVTSTGRVANSHSGDGTKTLKGCLAEASDEDRTNHSQGSCCYPYDCAGRKSESKANRQAGA